MKLIFSNGNKLIVRDVGPIIFELAAPSDFPLPIIAYGIYEDETARLKLKNLLATGKYRGGKL